MSRWQRQQGCWCLWPASAQGLVEFIGGSYLATNPQISYRRMLEGLAARQLAVHAWSYVPGFDHQLQAREGWQALRACRSALNKRLGKELMPVRVGHSLGCKLHLLAPDGGRNSLAFAALSFNNFTAERSIPLLGSLAPSLGVVTEFSPGPQETLRLIERYYLQTQNLVIRFGTDQLDQSQDLIEALSKRSQDRSQFVQMRGDHLTPASAGLRQGLLGSWADDPSRAKVIRELIQTIGNLGLGIESRR